MSDVGKVQKVTEARQHALQDNDARKRIALLLDADSFVEIDGFVRVDGEPSGVVCGYGAVAGSPVAVFSQDNSAWKGAVGEKHAAKIAKLYDFALKTGIPVVGIYDSWGARLAEGVGALSAYSTILRSINTLSGVVPQISLVLGACAGISSMLACSADFLIMSKGATLYMAAPDSDEAGTAEVAGKSGVAHLVCDDDATACDQARKLLSLLPLNNLAPAPINDYADPAVSEDALRVACENIASADVSDIVNGVCDQGNRLELLSDFGSSVYTGMGTMAGFPCGIVATHGKLDSDACAKTAKLVSVCDAFQIPVITFLNAEGLQSSAQAELCGSIRSMAQMAHVYADATTAKLTVITGAAYGGAFAAMAGSASGTDYTIAWPSAVISALDPKTAVAFLHSDEITADKSRNLVEAEYIENESSGIVAASRGVIDDVIDPALTRPALLSALDVLTAKRVSKNPKKHANIPL